MVVGTCGFNFQSRQRSHQDYAFNGGLRKCHLAIKGLFLFADLPKQKTGEGSSQLYSDIWGRIIILVPAQHQSYFKGNQTIRATILGGYCALVCLKNYKFDSTQKHGQVVDDKIYLI